MSDAETTRPLGTVKAFAAYLRAPAVIAPLGLRNARGWRELALLFLLQAIVLLAVVLPLMVVWQEQFGLTGPDAFDEVPDGWFLPLTILIAPVLEEFFFRGWLTGRKRALWLFACAVAAGALLYASTLDLNALVIGGLLLVVIIAAPVGWFLLRKRAEPPRWFTRAFPAIFYLVVLGFAALHLSNYSNWSLLILPLVLPQLWIGLMLGYIRMRVGLIGSILAHILSNSAVLAPHSGRPPSRIDPDACTCACDRSCVASPR